MYNDNVFPEWRYDFLENFKNACIRLVIDSYKEAKKEVLKEAIPKENTRRNQLCTYMKRKKTDYGLNLLSITTESGVCDDEYHDLGRTDIRCSLNIMDEEAFVIECKRFLKSDVCRSRFRRNYYNEGVRKFEENIYSRYESYAGMIIFLETGDIYKLNDLFISEIQKYSCNRNLTDRSVDYRHSYVYDSIHNRIQNTQIKLTHILMDFT